MNGIIKMVKEQMVNPTDAVLMVNKRLLEIGKMVNTMDYNESFILMVLFG